MCGQFMHCMQIATSTGTVHTSANARITSVAIRIRFRIRIRIRDKFNYLFTGPLPTFPENFMQIRLQGFCAKSLTDRQTDRQTNNRDYITSLAEVIKQLNVANLRMSFNRKSSYKHTTGQKCVYTLIIAINHLLHLSL